MNELNLKQLENSSLDNAICVVVVDRKHPEQQTNDFQIGDWWSAVPSILATLLAVYIVHKLTKRRDKEKFLYDLHAEVLKMTNDATASAISGWALSKGAQRKQAIAETKWRLQLLGNLLVRLRIISSGKRWKWRRLRYIDVQIEMEKPMSDFRRSLMIDPFEDPQRRAKKDKAAECESAKGTFVLALDLQLRNWISPF